MLALAPHTLAKVLEALRTHRNAMSAAKLTGVGQTTAWRIAKHHGITLISNTEHWKARRADPAFRAKQVAAVSGEAASRRMKAQHRNPNFHKKSIEAARRLMIRLNSDPAFRKASSERLTRLHGDPAYRAKLYGARSAAHKEARAKRRQKAIKDALRTLMQFDSGSDFRAAAGKGPSGFFDNDSRQGKGVTRL